jgi:hypothetical protein
MKECRQRKMQEQSQRFNSCIYSQRDKSAYDRYLYILVYRSTVHNAKLWNQPRCPSTDEWNFIQSLKKNEIMTFAKKMDGNRDRHVK